MIFLLTTLNLYLEHLCNALTCDTAKALLLIVNSMNHKTALFQTTKTLYYTVNDKTFKKSFHDSLGSLIM